MVVAAHFVFGLLLAASPTLHHHLHHDSNALGHACFVTVVSTGGCDAPGDALSILAVVPEILPGDRAPETDWVESVFQAGAVFEHGPPVTLI